MLCFRTLSTKRAKRWERKSRWDQRREQKVTLIPGGMSVVKRCVSHLKVTHSVFGVRSMILSPVMFGPLWDAFLWPFANLPIGAFHYIPL